MFGTPLYWRETHRQPKFLMFDGRVIVVMIFFVMHVRFWTFGLVVLTLAVLFWFSRKGVGPDDILRFIRARLAGKRRTARGLGAERLPVDFGFETEAHVERARQRIEFAAKAHEKAAAAAAAKAAKSAGKAM